jgi:hypothetical protein
MAQAVMRLTYTWKVFSSNLNPDKDCTIIFYKFPWEYDTLRREPFLTRISQLPLRYKSLSRRNTRAASVTESEFYENTNK